MTEKWAWVPGFEGSYKISDRGRVRSVHRVIARRDGTNQTIAGRIMRPTRHRSAGCPCCSPAAVNTHGYGHTGSCPNCSATGSVTRHKLERNPHEPQ